MPRGVTAQPIQAFESNEAAGGVRFNREQRRILNQGLIVPRHLLGFDDIEMQSAVPIARRVVSLGAPRASGKCADILDNMRILKKPMKYAALALASLFTAIVTHNVGNPQSVAQTTITLGAEIVASASIVISIVLFAVKIFQPETQIQSIPNRYGRNLDLLGTRGQKRNEKLDLR